MHAFRRTVELPSGHSMWLLEPDEDASAAFAALRDEAAADGTKPLGLCLLVRPDRPVAAVREDPRMVYGGLLADDSLMFLGFFEDADVRPRVARRTSLAERAPADHDPRIVPFAEQTVIGPADLVGLWVREGALPREQAEERAAEAVVVALDGDRLVGVATAYLATSAQLGLPVWHGRVFVAASERRRATAFRLLMRLRDTLAERFAGGDARAQGVLIEVESPVLRQGRPEAVWRASDFTFIGFGDDADLRIHWFAGARVGG